MKKARFVVFRARSKRYIVSNKLLLLLMFCFIMFVAFAVLVFNGNKAALSEIYSKVFSSFINELSSGFFKVLLLSFLLQLFSIITVILLAASAAGIVAIPIKSASSGFIIGSICAYAYYSYSFKGIVFSLLFFIIPVCIYFIAFLPIAKESVSFSKIFLKLLFVDSGRVIAEDFKRLISKTLVLLPFNLLSALVTACFSEAFIGLFKL